MPATSRSPRPSSPRRGGKLQVGLLLEEPAEQARQAALALVPDADRLAFGERELYWLPGGGFLESALDLKALAGLLGPTTFRTKGTVEQIASNGLSI